MKKTYIWIGAVLAVCGLSGAAEAACTPGAAQIRNGFGTGATLMQLSDKELTTFMVGLVDGVLMSPLFGAPADCEALAWSCVADMPVSQFAVLVRRYISEHPDEITLSAPKIAMNALFAPCLAAKQPSGA